MGVMEYLAARDEPASAAQIASAAGQSEHAVLSVLREAEERGWAQRSADGTWRLA